MPNNHFTNRKVAELQGKHLYTLGNNLCVREKPGGRKYYVFIYRQRIGDRRGKKIEMIFGPTAKHDIRAAYEWAQEQNTLIAKDIDPRTHRNANRQAAQKAALTRKTFREVAEAYFAERTDPKNPKRWVPGTAQQMARIKDRILETDIAEVFVNDTELVQLKGVEIIKSVAARLLPTQGHTHTGRATAPVMAARFRDFLCGTMDLVHRF